MRIPFAALLWLAAAAAPLGAVEIVELKSGRLYQAEEVSVRADRLLIRLRLDDARKTALFSVPMDKVVPEFVYYAWVAQTKPDDVAELVRLAEWSRGAGIFGHARKAYDLAAAASTEWRERLPELEKTMYEEEATWNFNEAWRLFREDEVTVARKRAETVVDAFPDSQEVGRAKDLLSILAEREQFLSEQKKQEEIAARARKQRKEMDRHLARVGRADRLVLDTRLSDLYGARRNLTWAAYAYRAAALDFEGLLAFVEVDDLRRTLDALIRDLEPRMVRAFSKLADLHYLMGDYARALDAVHEVLALDADNKQATGLRERILDGPPVPEPEPHRYYRGYYGYCGPWYPRVRPYVVGVQYYSSIGLGIATTRPIYRYPAGYRWSAGSGYR